MLQTVRRKITAAAAAAIVLWLGIGGPSRAQTDAMDADVRCLASIAMLPSINQQTHQFSDQAAQTMVLFGSTYYMGKINGRDPQFDIENGILKELPQLNTETVKSNLVRCGGEMQLQGKNWQAMGNDLTHRGQEIMKQQNATGRE